MALLVHPAIGAALADDVVEQKNVMMPARDGVRLATDVYLPSDSKGERLPAILIRTPYNKNGADGTAKAFAQRGYAVVVQDVRGRFASEGDFYIYVNEGRDGFDAVEWVAAQPWCNGDVGTWGPSYLAATQQAAAIENPPHLRTMFVLVGTSNYIEDGAGRGGAFALLHNMAYCFGLARNGKEASASPVVAKAMNTAYAQLDQWLNAHPLKRQSPLRHTPTYERWYFDWRAHPEYDDYWKQNGYNFEEHHDRYPPIPVCFVGGWFDIFKRGTLKSFEGVAAKNPATRLVMGPWTHGVGGESAGDVHFGAKAKVDMRALANEWFDLHLKKQEGKPYPRVRFFVMGQGDSNKTEKGLLANGGTWKTADTWPPPNAIPTPFYLHPGGRLAIEQAENSENADDESSRFQFDPQNPVPSIGGNIDSGGQLVLRGPQNQTPTEKTFGADNTLPLASRPDVLTFETEPLSEDIEIAGPMSVRLWVSSRAPDTDFTAKLIDVHPPTDDYPDGYAMNLEDGILRMRFRGSRSRPRLMTPGSIYEVEIDLWATANRFQKGHRIRLDISSSSFPMYDVNPNTGQPLGRHTRTIPTTNTVYHSALRPSQLILPVVR